jgi:hypothetical protein
MGGCDQNSSACSDFFRHPIKVRYFDILHDDIMRQIVNFLDIPTTCTLQRTSKYFYDLGNNFSLVRQLKLPSIWFLNVYAYYSYETSGVDWHHNLAQN